MICPNCKTDLDGDLIYETFLAQGDTPEEALESAGLYGATETTGRWGRQIGQYDMETDRTSSWQCPDCKHVWGR